MWIIIAAIIIFIIFVLVILVVHFIPPVLPFHYTDSLLRNQ